MVAYHGEDRFELREAPFRFEAGTPNIEGAIGLGAAIDYVRTAKLERSPSIPRALGAQLVEGLRSLPGAEVLGAARSDRAARRLVPSRCRCRR